MASPNPQPSPSTSPSTPLGAATPAVHLEDLFVRPEFRRKGIAKALFARLASIALERGDRFQWHVLDWNQLAIDFYESMGAHMLNQWRIMRIDGEALKALAAQSK